MDSESAPVSLGALQRVRRNGAEAFHSAGTEPGLDLLSFWQWSASDLVSNALRGVFAEYLVAQALGWADDRIREELASYVQSWHQERLSTISYLCPKTRAWDPQTGLFEEGPRRQARVHVFALLAHQNQATLYPLNLDQWEFYVVPTAVLDARERSQHSITLPSLKALHGEPVTSLGRWPELLERRPGTEPGPSKVRSAGG
jgi:hypothetical protein